MAAIISFIIGANFGVAVMCLLQVDKKSDK